MQFDIKKLIKKSQSKEWRSILKKKIIQRRIKLRENSNSIDYLKKIAIKEHGPNLKEKQIKELLWKYLRVSAEIKEREKEEK